MNRTILARRTSRLAFSRPQRGQSIVEVAVMGSVVIGLTLLVPVLGQYIHLGARSEEGARMALWDTTVMHQYQIPSGANTAEQNAVLSRVFQDSTTKITASPGKPASLSDPMFTEFSGATLATPNDVAVLPYQDTTDPGVVLTAIGKAFAALSTIEPGTFPPNSNGFHTAELTLKTVPLQYADSSAETYLSPFDSLSVQWDQKLSMLTDDWSASGPGDNGYSDSRSVVALVKTLLPQSVIMANPAAASAIGVLSAIPGFGDPFKDFIPDYIAPDVPPKDKLVPYASTY